MKTLTAKIITLFSLITIGCGPVPTPEPPTPPPAPRLVQATVTTDNGVVPQDIVATLATDAPYAISCPPVDGLNRIVCTLDDQFPIGSPSDPTQVYGATLVVSAKDYEPLTQRLLLHGRSQDLDDIILTSTLKPLPRLVKAGLYFKQATGDPITLIGATDFNLYNLYLQGIDITPILEQRQSLGFNLLRVWTAYDVCPTGTGRDGKPCQPIGRLVPREHPDFYGRVADFSNLLARYGFYIEWVAFTGRWDITLPSTEDKLHHWHSLIATLNPLTNVLLEKVNEWDHAANEALRPIHPQMPCPPAPLLSSAGSGQADGEPLTPHCTHSTYHPGMGSEWMRKAVHNAWEDVAVKAKLPVIVNEMTRFPDNDSSIEHAYDVGRGCTLMNAGCVFHSVTGKRSGLWAGNEFALAKAFTDGARSLPLICQQGAYRRIVDDTYLRVYEHVGVPANCRVNIRY